MPTKRSEQYSLSTQTDEVHSVRSSVASAGRPLCVAMQTPAWPLGYIPNGIITYVHHLKNEFEALGACLRVVTDRLGEGDWPDVVRVRRIKDSASMVERGLYRARQGFFGDKEKWRVSARFLSESVRDLNERDGVDVIECAETFGVPMWLDPSLKIPVVVRVHGPWFLVGRSLGVPDDREFRNRVYAEGKCLEYAKWVTCPSHDVLERTRNHYGLALENARVIGNPGALSGADQVWSLAEAEPDTVLFVGRFDKYKGGDLVLDAFKILAERRPNARLWFVGPDSGLETPNGRIHIADYMQMHLTSEVMKRIKLFGTLKAQQIHELRRRASVSLVASRYEVYGMTVVEAMSSGSPLVAPAVGAIPELVTDAENGVLVPGDDAGAIADGLALLLDDPKLASQVGRRGKEQSMTRLHPHTIAEQTLENYLRVAGS